MLGPILLGLPGAVLLLFVVAARRRTRLVADHAALPGLAHLDRVQTRARWVGLVAGVLTALAATATGRLGQGVFVAPAVTAVAVVGTLLVAEIVTWRSARTPGTASLETRRAGVYLPRVPLAWLGACTTGLAALLLLCRTHQNTVPDAMGTIGRQYAWQSADGTRGGGGGPYPGTFYSVPLAWCVALLAVLLVVGLAVVVRRPRNGADPVVVAVDDDARRRSATAMVAAALVGVTGELVLTLVGAVSGGEHYWPGPWWGLGLALASVALGAWAGAVYLVPGSPRLAKAVGGTGAAVGVQGAVG